LVGASWPAGSPAVWTTGDSTCDLRSVDMLSPVTTSSMLAVALCRPFRKSRSFRARIRASRLRRVVSAELSVESIPPWLRNGLGRSITEAGDSSTCSKCSGCSDVPPPAGLVDVDVEQPGLTDPLQLSRNGRLLRGYDMEFEEEVDRSNGPKLAQVFALSFPSASPCPLSRGVARLTVGTGEKQESMSGEGESRCWKLKRDSQPSSASVWTVSVRSVRLVEVRHL
jgi:hypothetical protein